jgi:hypothetical protein
VLCYVCYVRQSALFLRALMDLNTVPSAEKLYGIFHEARFKQPSIKALDYNLT